MADFWRFVHDQADWLQLQLNNLLLQTQSSSPPSVPKLELSHICDDHAQLQLGCNFLQDQRNQAQFAGSQRWILDCIIQEPHLRDRFFELNLASQQVIRKRKRLKSILYRSISF
jgi:hypothetical protein